MIFRTSAALALASILLGSSHARAQQPMDPPELSPPPLPKPEKNEPDRELPGDATRAPGNDRPWGLPDELLGQLAQQAGVYRDYAVRFSCNETARLADYDGFGIADSEKTRHYSYLLTREGDEVREYRTRLNREGRPKSSPVKDEEPFPPAYAWVFLFHETNQPFFSYRDLGDRFEGFDWVREIEFRGALSFTDGKSIRQWEGSVLVDAATFTPIEVRAQPANQDARIRAQFDRWAKSFNLIGFRLGPKPMAYRAQVEFRYRRDGLTFPTHLRYDTLRAVSKSDARPVKASTRDYDGYRFFGATAEEDTFEAPATR